MSIRTRLALTVSVLVCVLVSVATASCSQQRKDTSATTERGAPPLKALFVGGGGGDYLRLIPIITTRLHKTINIHFDIDSTMDVFDIADFAKPYDVVVYNFCQVKTDSVVLEHILAATRAGMPTVLIHCALHSFQQSPLRPTWVELVGIRSVTHDKYGPFHTVKADPSNPIITFFPADWSTPGDELYQTEEVISGTTALLTVKSPRDDRVHTVAWTRMFGKGRVFGTSLGHDTMTVQLPEYSHLLANGILWSTGHLQADGNPAPGYAAPAP